MNGIKVHHRIFIHCQRLIKKTFKSENIVMMKYIPPPPPETVIRHKHFKCPLPQTSLRNIWSSPFVCMAVGKLHGNLVSRR